MVFLKSIFFYFLAIRINLLKNLKKIYFSTNKYKVSLITKRPQKIDFFPNTFHFSCFTNYENFSFKVRDVSSENFWDQTKNKKDENKLNEFLWLNLIDRKTDNAIIRKILTIWIEKNQKINTRAWKTSVTCKRVLSWMFNANLVINSTNKSFQNIFFESMVIQINHLKLNYKFEKSPEKKIEIISAIIISGLFFKEFFENFNFGVKELEKIKNNFFDIDGFPLTRNPYDLLIFCKHFILIKECTKDAQKYVPDFLDEIIEKNLSCLKKITTPDKKIPLFNGSIESNLNDFYNYIDKLNIKSKLLKKNVGCLEILKNKKEFILFDVGEPPNKSLSKNYQSGPLSFEYYNEKEKIITNCGFGLNISPKAAFLSRLTSAQSTLCLNDTSIVKFERNKILNSAFGTSINGTFKIFEKGHHETDEEITSYASHNAYVQKFGYIHKRTICVKKNNSDVVGYDDLIHKKNNSKVNYVIRFHLNPGLDASLTIGGKSVLIKLKKNKSILFLCDQGIISVEKSIYLGGTKILNNLCISLSGSVNSENKTINWRIKKKIDEVREN